MVNISGSEQIPGLRKAAILMVMIGDEASSAILRQLDSGEVDEISREIARVQALTPEEAEACRRDPPGSIGAPLRRGERSGRPSDGTRPRLGRRGRAGNGVP